ncbi:hypothetical protein Tco_0890373 [Tanacetum coccineum]|uniref:Integrase, catalytic region, zinc finger, CCHC-type, peptidase aspartic, catalytic n=1 Tax=Tanacetum coccineum TaxID=301880 RepID=A0ABQ5BZY0_9ASTR
MATTDKESSAADTDNCPPMLEESDFESWKIRIERYICGKPIGKLIWKSIKNGPSPHLIITVTTGEGEQQTQMTREKTDEEFTEAKNNKERADIQATNILSQGLPRHIFNTLNQTETAKEIWENVELLMQGSGLIEQQKKETFKMDQTSGNADPLAYMAQATQSTSLLSQYVPLPPHGFQKQFPPTNNQLRTFTNPMTQAMIQAGHVARECKEKKQAKDLQWFKDKALLMEAKEKGAILDADAEAFLADVECTTPYVEPLAITTTMTFEVSHKDAYYSDVDEAPHAAAAFMANLMQTGPSTRQGTSNDTDFHSEVHTYDNHFFDNMNLQVSQEIHGGEQLDSDVDSIIDDHDNTIPYHQYQLNNKVESVPTDVSSVIPVELERYKTQVQNLEQSKVKKDLEQLVFERNKRNADLEEQFVSLKQQLLQHVESNKSLKTESEKLKADKNALKESYLEELVWLRNTNKVVMELLQLYGQPIQTVPMLSKRPTFSTKDLHKSTLGHRTPLYLKLAHLCRPTLYLGDIIVDPVHTPLRLDKEYDQCVIDKKSLEIENKNLLIQNECLLAESVSKDICSIVLTFDIVVPMSVEPRSNCVEEHSRNLELEAEILKSKVESNSNVSSRAAVPKKPKVLAPGLYVMTPKYIPPQKRNNREANTPLPRKETVSLVKKTNVNLPARSKNMKKVDNPLRNLNKRNHVDSRLSVKRTGFISKSGSVCKTCNECLVFGNHNKCGVKNLNYVNVKNPKVNNDATVKQVWKATRKIFASVGSKWRPSGRKFTLGDTCPLTRITKPEVVALEKSRSVSTSEPANNVIITPRFYKKPLTSYKRKDSKLKDTSIGSPSNAEIKVIQIVLWYLDSGCSRYMTGDRSKLINYVEKFIGTV